MTPLLGTVMVGALGLSLATAGLRTSARGAPPARRP